MSGEDLGNDLALFDFAAVEAEPAPRILVMWYPDWPVVALDPATPLGDRAIAVLEGGKILACSPAARAHGIRRGMRRRDAQSRLPSLTCHDYQPEYDARAFEPLLAAVEHVSPGVEPIRPGMCATAAQGPTRYFGTEDRFIDALGEYLESLGFPDARFGIADGSFAASQAAKADVIVPPGQSPTFLRDLPVGVLDRPELADLLRRMGLRTLGAFAELPTGQVAARFGADGVLAHRLAAGRERRRLAVRTPPPELTVTAPIDPPLERIDAIAFGVRRYADTFIEQLADRDLVCTALQLRIRSEDGSVADRLWRHPRWFSAGDVVDRVRWQLHSASPAGQGIGLQDSGSLTGAVEAVTFEPREVDRSGIHADELWGPRGPDERVHRAFARVQSIAGHTSVVTLTRSGGRGPRDFCVASPWGERPMVSRDPQAPWPGQVPDPAPSRILSPPWSVIVKGARDPIYIDDRGFLSEEPATIIFRDHSREDIHEWSGPWSSDESWWDSEKQLTLSRIQAITAKSAYLLALTDSDWWVEGIYD